MKPDLVDSTLLQEVNYLIGLLIEKHLPPAPQQHDPTR
jgi:hypothetical protein